LKKDILIPDSRGLNLALIPIDGSTWDLYLINRNEHSLRNILVVTEATGEEKVSSKLRYFLESIPPLSYIKFETVYGEVAELSNNVSVTYYIGIDIYEKDFSFLVSDLTNLILLPMIDLEGYLLE